MSKLVGVAPSKDPESPHAAVYASSAGVELECDPVFTLSPAQAIAFASVIMQAARERIEAEHERAAEISDPAALAALIPDEGVMMNGKKLTRVIRRRRVS